MRVFGPCCIITLASNLAIASVCKPRSFTNSLAESVIPTISNVLSATTTAVDRTLTSRFPTTSDDGTSAAATETETYVSESLFTTSVEITRTADRTTAFQSATTTDSSITLDTTTSTATTTSEYGSVSLISCLRSPDNKLNCHASLEDCPWGGSCTPIEESLGLFYWFWAPWGKTFYMGLAGVSQPPEGMNPIELQLSEL